MSIQTSHRPGIGIGVIVWKQDQVLLGKRIDKGGRNDMDTCWQFPGGHLEVDETVLQCAHREVSEETGLDVHRLHQAGYTNEVFQVGDRHYITLFVSAQWQSGEPQVLEKDKCECWRWFDYRQLPSPLFLPINLYLDEHGDLKTGCAAADIR